LRHEGQEREHPRTKGTQAKGRLAVEGLGGDREEEEVVHMVKLLVGQKGTGKTKRMIALANERIGKSDGSVVFINKNHRLMYLFSFS
jgi:hypothetical protein